MSTLRHHVQRTIFIVVAAFLCLSLFAPMVALADEAIAPGQSATIDTGGGDASLRSEPSYDGEVITTVPDGTSLAIFEGPVSGADGSLWYSASADGLTGYLSADLVTGDTEPTPPEASDTTEDDPGEGEAASAETAVPSIPWKEPVDMGVVVDNASESLPQEGLACRADARADADVITRVVPGNTLEVTGADVWIEGVAFLPVNCAGVGGFVRSDYVELVSEANAADEAATDAEVVAEATEEVTTEDVIEEDAEVAPEEALAEEPVAEEAATEAEMPEEVAAEETAAEAIETEEVVVEDPAVEEAVEDEVPAEDATTDEVVADEVVAEEPVAEEAVTEEPLAEEPVMEEPVAEEVTPEAAVVEDPAVDEATEEPAGQVVAEDVEASGETAAEPAQAEQAEAEEETARTPEPKAATEADSAEPVATEAAPEEEAEVESAAAPATVQFNDQVATAQPTQRTVDSSQVIGTAEVVGTNGEGLRCRTAASADASTIAVLAEGTTVQVLSVERNGYLGVICGGQAGYANVEFLYAGGAGDEIAANAGSVTVVGSGSGLNCRSGAGLSYRVITVVRDGTTLSIRGASSNGWAPVVCGGQNGYVSIDYVEAAGSTSNSGTTDGRVSAAATTMVVTGTNGDGVRCRTAASTSSSIITVLAEGTRVTTRGAASGGWVPVTCGGASGYISAQFLSAASGSTDGGSGTGTGVSSGSVKVVGTGGGGLRCRTTASLSGSVITVIPEGGTVAVRGAASNGWQPVTCSSRAGFVSTQFITATSGGTAPGGSTPTPSPATGSATVSGTNGDGVRCRSAASTSANVITVLAEGTRVSTRGSAQGGWVPVICGGTNGYVSAQYLTIGGTAPTPQPSPSPTPTPTPPATSGMVSGDHARVTDTLNLRYSASTGAGIATTAPAGTVVLITGGVTNGFYPVNWDGLKGFMSKDYLVKTTAALSERGGSGDSSPPPTSGDSGSNATGSAMASFALRYEGYPYVWATHGPSSFDCSGFTYWVTKNVTGKDIGWGLWSQVSAGTPVSRANLQPGDLVFFQNTYKAGLSHSGVYIGNNRFIHAENESTGVRISDLNSTYYGSRWYGAVRMT
ncbi:MAG TPA: SH3 domain-containing protein [Thermomicrobiales bacterium]|nr:SH3 domain-containing protein [Thermomicrobiales bacterium]